MQVNALTAFNLYVSAMYGLRLTLHEHKRRRRKSMGGEYDVGAAELRELAGKLSDLLQIRTLPISMK